MEETLKHCPHCDLDLPRSQFYNDTKSKDGKTFYCKDYYAGYYAANAERQKSTSLRAHRKKRYGLTPEEYTALTEGPCAICGEVEKRRVIDHCHKTGDGHVRGVLCDGCNIMLGGGKDDPEVLRAGAAYLEGAGK